MIDSKVDIVWAEKPGCSLPAAEVWIGQEYLWITLFIDDTDRQLKIEILPSAAWTRARFVNLLAVELVVATAKGDLLAMLEP